MRQFIGFIKGRTTMSTSRFIIIKKSAVVSALLALAGAASMAHAESAPAPSPITLSSGSGSLTFSQDLISALNINNVSVSPVVQTVGAAVPSTGVTLTSSGGTLTFSDLKVDLANKAVFGTLVGSNGIGSQSNLSLFTLSDFPSSQSFALSTSALDAFKTSLGLINISDFGAITAITAAVPEPSTYVLMGLGLVGLGLAKRRQRG
jgi:hypothetical protein